MTQNKMQGGKFFAAILSLLMLGLALAGDAPALAAPRAGDDVYTQNPIARIAKESSPAVVNIDTETMVTRNPHPFANDPFFREFFGQEFERFNRSVPMRGKGSGFIVDKEGYIITNNHVVEGADKITVTMQDGRHLEAKLIGKDPTFDLAVIKVDAEKLPVLPMGDSDAAEVGEWVVAIGNPHGFEHTVTAGIISAKNRTLQAADINFQGFMQTDAAINPGNSGGPLINLNGEVVGINTAIVPYAQGIGFAVPVNMAKQVMDDLIKHGEVKRGWLGVMLQTLTPGFAETYKIPTPEGAIVSDIVTGSPAEKAGFKRGDVIVSVDGDKIKNSQDVVLRIRNKMMGDRVRVEVYRDGKKTNLRVTLGDIPGKDVERKEPRRRTGVRPPKQSSDRIGATVSEIDDTLKEEYGLSADKGIVVTAVDRGSIAARIGLKAGDQILEVNRKRVESVSDWEKSVENDPATVVLLVSRGGQTLFFTYKK
jgi:serine protease Do